MDAPYAFVQWKGTDACMDVHCKCGAHLHFDGYFAYRVKCPRCSRVYQLPTNLHIREIQDEGEPYVVAQDFPDEDD